MVFKSEPFCDPDVQVASGFFVVQLKAGAYILRNERNISQIPLFLHSAVRDKKKSARERSLHDEKASAERNVAIHGRPG